MKNRHPILFLIKTLISPSRRTVFQRFFGMCICHFVKRRIALKEIVFLPQNHDAHFSSRLSQKTKQNKELQKNVLLKNVSRDLFVDIEMFLFYNS